MYLCEGRRAGRAGSLASACLGCNGNCLGIFMCQMCCLAAHYISQTMCIWLVVMVLFLWQGDFCRHGRRWQILALENHWSAEWMPMYSIMCCPGEEAAWGLKMVCSQTSEKTQCKYRSNNSYHGSDWRPRSPGILFYGYSRAEEQGMQMGISQKCVPAPTTWDTLKPPWWCLYVQET